MATAVREEWNDRRPPERAARESNRGGEASSAARKAPRLTHGERPLDAMALESLGRSHGDRVAETVPSAGASPGLFDGNTGWGGSGGRLRGRTWDGGGAGLTKPPK